MNPESKNRLFELFAAHAADALTPDENASLQETLRHDAEARRLWFVHQDVELGLQVHLSAESLLQAELPAKSGRWLSWRPLAAAALVTMGIVSLWLWKSRQPVIAELVEVQQAKWVSCTLPTEPGSRLGVGRLRLVEGLARLRFARGAEVTLEGPAELELSGPELCRLHHGSLVAHVPEQAQGFAVLMPHATLIDHGTDFGISTDVSGHARVHVMQGEVELRHASGAKPMRLTTRQMTDITPQDVLPPRPLEGEPRLREAQQSAAATFTAELTTLAGRGAAAYAWEPGAFEHQSDSLLLLKNDPSQPGYARKVLLRFDLRRLVKQGSIQDAQLVLNFGPSGFGYPSRESDARIAVYALTDDAADEWDAVRLTWQTQPAFDADQGRVDESKAERVGEFTVPRGVQSGSFVVDDPRLVARMRSDANGLLTLILVREGPIKTGGGLVFGIAGNRHPTLPPPTLRVR